MIRNWVARVSVIAVELGVWVTSKTRYTVNAKGRANSACSQSHVFCCNFVCYWVPFAWWIVVHLVCDWVTLE